MTIKLACPETSYLTIKNNDKDNNNETFYILERVSSIEFSLVITVNCQVLH